MKRFTNVQYFGPGYQNGSKFVQIYVFLGGVGRGWGLGGGTPPVSGGCYEGGLERERGGTIGVVVWGKVSWLSRPLLPICLGGIGS